MVWGFRRECGVIDDIIKDLRLERKRREILGEEVDERRIRFRRKRGKREKRLEIGVVEHDGVEVRFLALGVGVNNILGRIRTSIGAET